MPSITVNDVALNYYQYPADSVDAPTLVFTHSLIWDASMFDRLIEPLKGEFNIINIDQHGHGLSGYRTPLVLTEMARDYGQLLDALNLNAVHWLGLSMGGMVGMRLAYQRPEKIRSLTLMDTSARPEKPELKEMGKPMIEMMRAGQAEAIVDATLQIFFGPKTFAEQPALIEHYRNKFLGYEQFEGIYQAAMAVFNREDFSPNLAQIEIPSLVIVGADDSATLPEESELMAEKLPNAQLKVIADVGHMSVDEDPQAVRAEIVKFLRSIG